MALLPTNPRDQRFLFLGLAGVIITVAYWQLVWTDGNDDVTRLAVCADSLDSANVKAQVEAGKSSVKAQAEATEYSRELDLLRRLVPVQTEVPSLLDQISNAARAAGLELADVKPDGVLTGAHFDTYKFTLGVTGPYHQVAAFLTNIGSLQRIVVPINLKLARSGKQGGEKRAAPGEVLLEASFGIETYVAHPPSTAPPEPPKPGGNASGCQSVAAKLGVQGLPSASGGKT